MSQEFHVGGRTFRPGAAGAATASLAAQHPIGAPEVVVDVREDLRAGREPFSRIMAAIAELPDDAVLHLRAIFEPAPLFRVLGTRGFHHESKEWAPEDWSVWFWRDSASAPAAPAADASAPEPSAPEPTAPTAAPDEIWLDVRGLEPPEPMVRTLAALETLERGRTLVQLNSRAPMFLLPMLGERGFTFTLDDSAPDRVLVRIRHRE
jgi:uncharacterized protein (DUF2249 family)